MEVGLSGGEHDAWSSTSREESNGDGLGGSTARRTMAAKGPFSMRNSIAPDLLGVLRAGYGQMCVGGVMVHQLQIFYPLAR